MFDMTILVIAFIAVICLAAAFFGVAGNGDGDSPLLAGISTVRKFYEKSRGKDRCTVLYINIFYENLQTMIERSELANIRKQVEREVLQLCRYGRGEAAQVDGNNYIVVTDLPAYEIEDFCKSFLSADKKSYKLIEAFIGVYILSESEADFLKSAGYAKKASRVAKAAEEKYLIVDRENLKNVLESDNIERNIENFIDNNDFYQLYQPIFSATTGEIVGCEALTRLKGGDVNDILPHKFLNAIKKEKLYGKFDMYVFRKCCEWASKRRDSNLFITCKFAASTLVNKNVVENIISTALMAGVSNSMVTIQVAQDNIDQNKDSFKWNVSQLKKEGFKFCMDNFGKGYTSLGDIAKIAPDAIKLDRSLIHNGLEGPGRIIFNNVVMLAKELKSVVLCGGIENEEQKLAALDAGCDILQGFYLGKPIGEEEFDKLLEKQKAESAAAREENILSDISAGSYKFEAYEKWREKLKQ